MVVQHLETWLSFVLLRRHLRDAHLMLQVPVLVKKFAQQVLAMTGLKHGVVFFRKRGYLWSVDTSAADIFKLNSTSDMKQSVDTSTRVDAGSNKNVIHQMIFVWKSGKSRIYPELIIIDLWAPILVTVKQLLTFIKIKKNVLIGCWFCQTVNMLWITRSM